MNHPVDLASSAAKMDILGAELAEALNRLDVPFIAVDAPLDRPQPLAPPSLLAKLAASPEARLRLAVIPLLLRHPAFHLFVNAAFGETPLSARGNLQCYFVAAVLLQRKYWERLQVLVTPLTPIPPYFFEELEIPRHCDPDTGLRLLAARQAHLSQRKINWQGTYEHAAQQFLKYMERRTKWNV